MTEAVARWNALMRPRPVAGWVPAHAPLGLAHRLQEIGEGG